MVAPISSRNASGLPSSITKTGSGSTGTCLPSMLVIQSISWPQNLHRATGSPPLRRRGELLHHAPLQQVLGVQVMDHAGNLRPAKLLFVDGQQGLSHAGGEKRHAQQAVRVRPFQPPVRRPVCLGDCHPAHGRQVLKFAHQLVKAGFVGFQSEHLPEHLPKPDHDPLFVFLADPLFLCAAISVDQFRL